MRAASQPGQSDRLRNEGITETAIIRLAQRIARETDDLGQAWLDLQNAMDIAVRVQQEGRVPSNHGDFVDEVLTRVTGLAAEGEYTAASDAIAAALEADTARRARLLDSGIKIAMLEGNSATAAEYLIRKADLEAGGRAGFGALRALQDTHYVDGRDKGIAIDLEISMALARLVLTRARTADERGTALNDLGVSLRILGERESGTARLEEAVTAYRAALEESSRDRVPLDWARAQMNLGNALRTLGDRESGTARLEEAVTAYRAALEESTRDRVPLEWAKTQMNIGNALATIGERESGTDRLEEAVIAFRSALEEHTRDRVPLDWAMTQMNLGTALATIGERESGTARLEEAVTAYRAALEESTRDRVPLEWARTQMNLGTALAILGQREVGTARLEDADTAYRHALEEWTRDRVPLDWAMTQANLADLERAFFDKTGEAAHLERAEDHARAAQKVFHSAGARHYEEITERTLSAIAARRGG
ncbi:tetratricopeptide repeat protein [uncultured Roseovarius sp.]|uniref:tetratricopeptide repeat protein n=1 Tax=uncultured Roseovarius sp. TaxID=293344 RepID=UPI002606676E|nr:tetratricopeptide repeat protein [uncultured Roseovarius sp.]